MKLLQLKQPLAGRKLTTRERIIVLEASKLHGCIFPPWKDHFDDDDADPVASVTQTSFTDDFNFTLSKAQSEDFGQWARIPYILHVWVPPPGSLRGQPLDLVQDLTTDCSVVASLCAITTRTERGFPDLCESIFHRWNTDAQSLDFSSDGKYVLRLNFNGCSRRVTIDDKLPVSRSGRSLFVLNQNNPSILWPALLEKAYLKVRGGYDFPGSNSGTDLAVLTGWIPEQILLQSDDLDRNALWHRLYAAFGYGDVLVTIGTGKLGIEEETGSGLATQHDYAIVDMRSGEGGNELLVKNPWSSGTQLNTISSSSLDDAVTLQPRSSYQDGSRIGAGSFWMCLNQIFQYFESLYLNWNPGLFNFREDAHLYWDMSGPRGVENSFRLNPQYVIQSPAGGLLWLSLSRHFTTRSRSPTQNIDCSLADPPEDGFISIYAFKGDKRVHSNKGAIKNSPYVDSPNTLLKLDLPERSSIVIALSGQALPLVKHQFSISCFSTHQAELHVAPEKYAYKYVQKDAWMKLTAGGNFGSRFYFRNPQYRVTLKSISDLCLMLETPSSGLPVHVALLWANGKRVRTISSRDLLCESGEYSSGFALAETTKLSPGSYTAVCSTFDADQLAQFELHISSSSPCEIEPIAAVGAGRYEAHLEAAIFCPDVTCLQLPIMTDRINRLIVSVWPQRLKDGFGPSIAAPMKVSIVAGRGDQVQVLATSGNGEFVEPTDAGVLLEDVDVRPDQYLRRGVYLTIERLITSGLATNECLDVSIQSEEPLRTGQWIEA